jgi:hypothetical protein
MSLNTVSTTYSYEIGDTAYFIMPRSSADVAFKQVSIKQVTVIAKRNYVQPTSSTPVITGPNISVIQYDIRFLDNTTKTVTPIELLSGLETIAAVLA